LIDCLLLIISHRRSVQLEVRVLTDVTFTINRKKEAKLRMNSRSDR